MQGSGNEETDRSPEKVQAILCPVELESKLGGLLELGARQLGVVGGDEQVRREAHRGIQDGPRDWEGNRWWLSL